MNNVLHRPICLKEPTKPEGTVMNCEEQGGTEGRIDFMDYIILINLFLLEIYLESLSFLIDISSNLIFTH